MSQKTRQRSHKVHKSTQNRNRLLAAKLLFEDILTDEQIAEKCNVSRRAIAKWKKDPLVCAEISRLQERAKESAQVAVERKAFNTIDRLTELAELAPSVTNGTISGQVKACLGIAQIRGEIIQRHEDVTEVSASERRKRALELLRRADKRNEAIQ